MCWRLVVKIQCYISPQLTWGVDYIFSIIFEFIISCFNVIVKSRMDMYGSHIPGKCTMWLFVKSIVFIYDTSFCDFLMEEVSKSVVSRHFTMTGLRGLSLFNWGRDSGREGAVWVSCNDRQDRICHELLSLVSSCPNIIQNLMSWIHSPFILIDMECRVLCMVWQGSTPQMNLYSLLVSYISLENF